jgi:gluconokinase
MNSTWHAAICPEKKTLRVVQSYFLGMAGIPPFGASMLPTRVLVLMGAAGSGKTTIGKSLSADLGWPFYDGDDYHPQGNIAKMAQGLALNDQDRLPWLRALHDLIAGILSGRGHGIVACSALKSSYREVLRGNLEGLAFVYLKGSYSMLEARLKARKEHYFRAELLTTQLEILEEPEEALTVDAALEPSVLCSAICQTLGLHPANP